MSLYLVETISVVNILQGRTFEEIDILFANKTSARHFADTKVDAYADDSEGRIIKDTDA
jgi:SP family general alpha glucoside:H+ symporter-like MFS transporter